MRKLKMPHQLLSRYALFLLLTFNSAYGQTLNAPSPQALVSIKDAWVRPTNPGQEVGAAYMTLTSKQDVNLLGVTADVTQSIEIHNMSMENGVMKMRMLETLMLKAGMPYKLALGGFHLMLFDLKKPLAVGKQVNFVFTFKSKDKRLFKQKLSVMVQAPIEDAATH